MSIPDITDAEESLISIVSKSSEPVLAEDFFTRMIVEFEVSRDAIFVQRSAYTLWAVLGDVGGLNGVIFSVAATIVSIFAYNKDENYLASKLFTLSNNQKRKHP